MRRAIAIIVVSFLVMTTLGSPHETLNIPVVFQDGLRGYLEIEASSAGGPLRQENRQHATAWVNDLFDIQITQDRSAGQRFLKLHVTSPSRTALGIDALSLHMFVPAARIDGVWTPSGRVSDDRLISADPGTEFVTQSAANYGIPYLAAATSSGKNLLALGLLEQDLMVQLRAAPAQNGSYEFQIQANVPPNRAEVNQQFFVSSDPSYSWFDIAQKYADWVDAATNYTQFPVTDRAYMPVYYTWYWSRDAVDDHRYMRTSELASQAGLGTFLADSGWDTPTGE